VRPSRADVRGRQRGRVVDAIARHGDLLALCLQQPHETQLVLGRGASDHKQTGQLSRQLFVVELPQSGSPGQD
jgi:hypothetical protein